MISHDLFLRAHNIYERRAFRIILKAIRKAVRSLPLRDLDPNFYEAQIVLNLDIAGIESAIKQAHAIIAESYHPAIKRSLPKGDRKKLKPFSLFNRAFQEYIKKFYSTSYWTDSITKVKKTLSDTIIASLQKSEEEGEPFQAKIDRLIKEVNEPGFYQAQAYRIARTETTAAMNSAAEVTAEFSGMKMEKVWISSRDGKERPAHAAANGQKVMQNDKFEVGGEMLKFPGDRSSGATAGNIVNCRCTFGYLAVRDTNGNIIWDD